LQAKSESAPKIRDDVSHGPHPTAGLGSIDLVRRLAFNQYYDPKTYIRGVADVSG
jgi:hypothetical protein